MSGIKRRACEADRKHQATHKEKAAILIANGPDGYEGQAFCRWVADIMAKGKSIDWEKYC